MTGFNLDDRVRITDGREGFVLGGVYQGGRCIEVTVMTDDYIEVKCLETHLRKIRRNGPTKPFGQEKKLIYPIEATNHMKLREAILHDHWARCGNSRGGSPYPEFFRDYKAGRVIPLPAVEDIRDIFVTKQLAFVL